MVTEGADSGENPSDFFEREGKWDKQKAEFLADEVAGVSFDD
jgi:hypothetical protein